MNSNHQHEPDFEDRLRALAADDAPRPDHQAALRERALAAFDRALAAQTQPRTWKQIIHFGRNIMRRPLYRYSIAAAIGVGVLAWISWPGADTAAAAFGQLVDALVSARSARFKTEVKIEGQAPQSFK